MNMLRFIIFMPLFISLSFFLGACKEEKLSGAGEMRWDREICARCAMAVSDRNFSAQVRGARADKKTKLYKFDDLGCAVIWLDKQKWKDALRTEIWVNDHRNGKWIDARTAWYVEMNNTPMDYGLGAQTEKVEGAINYEQAKKHIYTVEERFNRHTGQPLQVTEPVKTEAANKEPSPVTSENNK